MTNGPGNILDGPGNILDEPGNILDEPVDDDVEATLTALTEDTMISCVWCRRLLFIGRVLHVHVGTNMGGAAGTLRVRAPRSKNRKHQLSFHVRRVLHNDIIL